MGRAPAFDGPNHAVHGQRHRVHGLRIRLGHDRNFRGLEQPPRDLDRFETATRERSRMQCRIATGWKARRSRDESTIADVRNRVNELTARLPVYR